MKGKRQRIMAKKVLGKILPVLSGKQIFSEASLNSHWLEQSQKATHSLTTRPKGVSGDIFICAVLPPQAELGFKKEKKNE